MTQEQTVWIPEETFGDRLRRIRRGVGLNQEAFVARLDNCVGIKAYGSWEAGSREPRGAVAFAKRIELAFGVPAAWTLGLDVGSPGPTSPDGGTTLTDG